MKKEDFHKIFKNSIESLYSPRDAPHSSSQYIKYSENTTKKLNKILDYFDNNPKNTQSFQHDPSLSTKLKYSKNLYQLKNQFVGPQDIISKANSRYDQEKLLKSSSSIGNDNNEFKSLKSNRFKNIISIKKGNLESIKTNIFQNELLLDFIKNKTQNPQVPEKNCFNKNSSRNLLYITEPTKLYKENKRLNDFYCTLTNTKSKYLIPNFSSIINELFPELSDYFYPVIVNEQESSNLNENKQILFFNKILDMLILKFDEKYIYKEYKEEVETIGKMNLGFDSIFKDFCLHMEVSSQQRSYFLRKIWKKYQENCDKANQNLEKFYTNLINELKKKSNKLKDKNKVFKEKIYQIEEEQGKLEKRCNDLIEQNKLLSHDLLSKEKEYNNLINEKSDLENKEKEFINDLEEFVISDNQEKIMKKERRNEFNQILMMIKNIQEKNSGINKNNKTPLTNSDISGNITTKPSLYVDQILKNRNKRINYLGQKYFGIKPLDNQTKMIQIENAKKEKEDGFENRKKKILQENVLNLAKPIMRENNNGLFDKNKLQFKLYLNKGIDLFKQIHKEVSTQTESIGSKNLDNNSRNDLQSFVSPITSSVNKIMERLNISLEYIQKNVKNEEMCSNIEKFDSILHDLEMFIEESQDKSVATNSVVKSVNEAKLIVNKLVERNDKLYNEVNNMVEECNGIIKNNDRILEFFDRIKEKQESLVESYQEISKLINKGYLQIKSKIENYLLDKEKINYFTFSNLAKELFEGHYEIIGEDIDLNKMLEPSIQPAKIKTKLTKFPSRLDKNTATLKNELKKNELMVYSQEELSSSQSLIVDSLKSQLITKSTLSMKKLEKIINYIYFQVLTTIYKKNKENWIDEPFIDTTELPLIYFSNTFGIEKISVRKNVEFLLNCFSKTKDSKRIGLFTKYFLKTQNKVFLSDKKYNNNYIQKNIILFLLKIKELDDLELMIINWEEKENIDLYLISNKLRIIFEEMIKKFPISNELKDRVSSFFEGNQKQLTKNLKHYYVIDFDNFMEFYCRVFEEIKLSIESYLELIYNALTLEKTEGKMNLFELVICFSTLFHKKDLLLEEITDLFKTDEGLTLNQFKNYILTHNYFDLLNFQKLLYLDKFMVSDLYNKLYYELTLNNNLIDQLTRRVFVLKANPCAKSLNKKIKALNTRINNINSVNNENNMLIMWLFFRFLDIVTYELYNSVRLHSICNPLSIIIDDFSQNIDENVNSNILFLYVLSRESSL